MAPLDIRGGFGQLTCCNRLVGCVGTPLSDHSNVGSPSRGREPCLLSANPQLADSAAVPNGVDKGPTLVLDDKIGPSVESRIVPVRWLMLHMYATC